MPLNFGLRLSICGNRRTRPLAWERPSNAHPGERRWRHRRYNHTTLSISLWKSADTASLQRSSNESSSEVFGGGFLGEEI